MDRVWSPTKHWPANGPNLPAVVSQIGSLADCPMRPYGNQIHGGERSGYLFVCLPFLSTPSYRRLLSTLSGFVANGDSFTHRKPAWWPTNAPFFKWCILFVTTHSPWLSQ